MLFVGLTGGLGSGKSEALAAFERLGAATLSSDAVVHELLGTDEVRNLLRERWGDRVVEAGAVDRTAIAAIVFEQPDELAWLEGELFPRVGLRTAAWRAELEAREPPPEIAMVEVPLLFEAGRDAFFDATVAVVADEALREERAAVRGHEGVAGREERQLTQAEKAARADFVIQNDGSLAELEGTVGAVLDQLRERAGG